MFWGKVFLIRPPDVLLSVCKLVILESDTCPKSKHFSLKEQVLGPERCHSCSRKGPGWDPSVGGGTSLRRSLWSRQVPVASARGFLASCTGFHPKSCHSVWFVALTRCWSQDMSVQVLTLPLPCCVALDSLFNLSEHLLSHLQDAHANSNHLLELMKGLDETWKATLSTLAVRQSLGELLTMPVSNCTLKQLKQNIWGWDSGINNLLRCISSSICIWGCTPLVWSSQQSVWYLGRTQQTQAIAVIQHLFIETPTAHQVLC